MDIITHLTKEHREAEGLMASLSESEPGPARNALIRGDERRARGSGRVGECHGHRPSVTAPR